MSPLEHLLIFPVLPKVLERLLYQIVLVEGKIGQFFEHIFCLSFQKIFIVLVDLNIRTYKTLPISMLVDEILLYQRLHLVALDIALQVPRVSAAQTLYI